MNYQARLKTIDANGDYDTVVSGNSIATNGMIDAISITLIAWAAVQGVAIISDRLVLADRIFPICSIVVGLVFAIGRARWNGESTTKRLWSAALLWTASVCLLYFGVGNQASVSFACSAILTGWCLTRLRGESFISSTTLGLVLLIPLSFSFLNEGGYLKYLEFYTASMTSLFGDFIGQTNVQVGTTVVFRELIADEILSTGQWDDVESYLGIGVFCILAFRRRLVHAAILLASCILFWVTIQSLNWVMLSVFAKEADASHFLPFHLRIYLSVLGISMVYFQDKFLAFIFRPIPFSLFAEKSSLFAFMWNWFCYLPNPILRIPRENRIARHWRRSLRRAGKTSNFLTDIKWFKRELFTSLNSPMRFVGSVLEACRGWRSSRRLKELLVGSPSAVILSVLVLVISLSFLNRNDSLTERLSAESNKVCTTESLEAECFQSQEKDFAFALSGTVGISEQTVSVVSENAKRYVEILSKRILLLEPSNQTAGFRLGMICDLKGEINNAAMHMRSITSRKLGDFPQANAWLAKHLIIKKAQGENVSENELQTNLQRASRWNKCEYRLLFLYSSLLEANGEQQKAVEIAKLAVESNPQYILDLARLYVRIGDDRGRSAAATRAEAFFAAKNFREDNEANRLAISDARLLNNQLVSAGEVLSEGLHNQVGGQRSRRQLSEIQRMIYLLSVPTSDNLDKDMDLSLLEAMVDADPSNPNNSSEIAKLLATKTKPSKKLLENLKTQVDAGVANFTCHLILGEKFFTTGNLKEAQRHWELAVGLEPESVAAINNLAICLVKVSPENADRSLELITKANLLIPNNVDVLDTWGEISMIANRPRDAVNKFEWAIRQDSSRLDIRKKLVVAYQTAGLKEMSRTQEKIVQGLENNNGLNNRSQ